MMDILKQKFGKQNPEEQDKRKKQLIFFYIFLSCFFIYTAESVVKTILIQYHCCIKLSLLLLLPLPEDPEDPDAPGEASLLFI